MRAICRDQRASTEAACFARDWYVYIVATIEFAPDAHTTSKRWQFKHVVRISIVSGGFQSIPFDAAVPIDLFSGVSMAKCNASTHGNADISDQSKCPNAANAIFDSQPAASSDNNRSFPFGADDKQKQFAFDINSSLGHNVACHSSWFNAKNDTSSRPTAWRYSLMVHNELVHIQLTGIYPIF